MRKKLLSFKNNSKTALLLILFFMFTLQLTRAQTFYQYKEIGPYEGDAEADRLVYQDEIIITPSGIAIYRYQFPDITMITGYSRSLIFGIKSSNILIVILTNSSGHDEFQVNRDFTDISQTNILDLANITNPQSSYDFITSTRYNYTVNTYGSVGYMAPQTIYSIIINNDSINSNCHIYLSRWVGFEGGTPVEIFPYHYIILACSFIALLSGMFWIYWKRKKLRNEKENP